jgi:muramoyltetrapeptide carboxypeptidase
MNRKKFLSSIFAAGAALPVWRLQSPVKKMPGLTVMPEYLRPGDTIGISCPAGAITEKEILPAVKQIESWGFKTRIGATIGKKDFTFGGTDEERLKDFQDMLDDPGTKAILCARGGYGAVRIIDELRWEQFIALPKWIIGFSDITVLHSHLNRNFRIASLHSKMCNSFPDDWDNAEPVQKAAILSIQQALKGEKIEYPVLPNVHNKEGNASGELVGGNLSTIESMAGTKSDIKTEGKIIFVEDTGEYLYGIDRMFWNLKRTGKLEGLKGLIIGGFKIKPDDPGEEFGKTIQDIVLEKVKEYNYPVCFDFPVGHQIENYALKCGGLYRLEVSAGKVIFREE